MIIQIIGWMGMAIIIFTHILVSTKKVTGTSKRYQVVNLIGAVMVGINVYYARSWPALALQGAWALIAIYELIKNALKPHIR